MYWCIKKPRALLGLVPGNVLIISINKFYKLLTEDTLSLNRKFVSPHGRGAERGGIEPEPRRIAHRCRTLRAHVPLDRILPYILRQPSRPLGSPIPVASPSVYGAGFEPTTLLSHYVPPEMKGTRTLA